MYVEVVVFDFDAGFSIGDEVPVPRGAAVDTTGRGELHVAIVVGQIYQRVYPFLATSGSASQRVRAASRLFRTPS
jgi:hypothetical protein